MTAVAASRTQRLPQHQQERVELACAFRWAARLNFHESVANHFSVAVNPEGTQFLMNPNGAHFSRVRASELLLLDAEDPSTMQRADAPDPTAWALHGALHRRHAHARCVLHAHPKNGTILASLADSRLLPIDQNCARFFNRIAIDEDFSGMALGEEAERCVEQLATKRIMIMGNHGVLVAADSIAQAFDDLYYLERSAETLVGAYMTGKKLRV
ncbi:MAG: class II aldolase/adducin family protein, partial [Alphaproteobacteria bacterium]|nr:class II aldolase/adducin family protein [Alphaproteobacteria bacterium]